MRINQLPVSATTPGGSMGLNMFCNFYSGKNHKIAKNLATTEAREKLSTYLESLDFLKSFNECLTRSKSIFTL
jgi:hypothetical protein